MNPRTPGRRQKDGSSAGGEPERAPSQPPLNKPPSDWLEARPPSNRRSPYSWRLPRSNPRALGVKPRLPLAPPFSLTPGYHWPAANVRHGGARRLNHGRRSGGSFCGGSAASVWTKRGAPSVGGKVKLILEDGLGLVDFHLSNRSCILYISEADMVVGNGFKRRLVQFRNARSLQGIIIVEKTQISDQYFPAVQKFVVLELGMTLLPVANQSEAAQFIVQLVHELSKDPASNPFLNKRSPTMLEASLFQTVQQIPGIGKTKALLLLKQFGSIYKLCNASVPELEEVVGCALAQQIHTFFTRTM